MVDLNAGSLRADIARIERDVDEGTMNRLRWYWEPKLSTFFVRLEAAFDAAMRSLFPRPRPAGEVPTVEIQYLWRWRGELLKARLLGWPGALPPTNNSTPPPAEAAAAMPSG